MLHIKRECILKLVKQNDNLQSFQIEHLWLCRTIGLHVIMGLASKHRKEMKLKLSCVLDSSPICLLKVRIKMLMIISYRLVTCSLAVNIFSVVKMSKCV